MPRTYNRGRVFLKVTSLFLSLLLSLSLITPSFAQALRTKQPLPRALSIEAINGATDAYNVADFGATGTCYSSDHQAFTDALAAAKADPYVKSITGPPRCYGTHRPILVDENYLGLIMPRHMSFNALGFTGPTVLISPPRKPLITTESLLSGSGYAMVTDRNQTGWFGRQVLRFSDALTMRLNGMRDFTFEATVKISRPITEENTISAAAGSLKASDGQSMGYRLSLSSNNTIWFHMQRENGSLIQLFTPANTVTNGVHHIAFQIGEGRVTVFWDGTPVLTRYERNLRLVQRPHEEITLAGEVTGYPQGHVISDAGQIDAMDGVRWSNVARYSHAGFTPPTSKASNDAHTLMLLNFDNLPPGFVVGETNHVPHYALLPEVDTTNHPFAQIGNVALQNITISGGAGAGGVYAYGAIATQFNNVSAGGTWQGFLGRDIYGSSFNNTAWSGGAGRFAFAVIDQGEALSINNLWADGGDYCVAITGSSGGAIQSLYTTPRTNTRAQLLFKGDATVIKHFHIGDEVPQPGQTADIIIADNFGNLTLLGGQIGTQTARPSLLVDGFNTNARANLFSTTFYTQPVVPYLIKVVNGRPGLVGVAGISYPAGTILTNDPGSVSIGWRMWGNSLLPLGGSEAEEVDNNKLFGL